MPFYRGTKQSLLSAASLYGGDLLYDKTLVSSGYFYANSISQRYTSLLLLLNVRGDVSSTVDSLYIFFNNDTTTTNYNTQLHNTANGATHNVSEQATSLTALFPAASSPTSSFGYVAIYITNYASTSYLKNAYAIFGAYVSTDALREGKSFVYWPGSEATPINKITIATDNDPTDRLVAGSRLRIIGIK